MVLEQMPVIDPGGQQRIALQIRVLTIRFGRHAHITD
jgi:hypothetical protein